MENLINLPLLTAYLGYFLLVYLAVVSIVAVVVTVIDKISAKKHKRRIPESDLMLIGALGGSALMLVTMLFIRHKTKHIKFMLGLPAIILLQCVVGFLIIV